MPDKPSELKPCPCCGTQWVIAGDAIGEMFVVDYPTGACLLCEGYWIDFLENGKKLERHHVDQWNRRTPDRAALVEVARRALVYYMPDHARLEDLDADAEMIASKYLAEQEGE